ncbi:MAG: hypothetical protein K2I42_04085 [Anaeroplasmataceae bacterium]|nr:hypothetical protein [Anaeroplasmataceae bacterium]
MFFGVVGKIVLPIIVAVVFLSLILGVLLWFIVTRYKFKLMAKELKNIEEEIDLLLEQKKSVLKELLEEEFIPLDYGKTIHEKYLFNEQLNQIYHNCKEKKEAAELLENLLVLEGQLSELIQEYNLAVAKFKNLTLEFPHSLIVGTKYNQIEYFGSMQNLENQEETDSTC